MKSEVDTFVTHGLIEDSVNFGPGSVFVYRLISADCAEVSANFESARLTVQLPSERVRQWVSTDLVSISAEQHADEMETLRILVEKDFECLAPRPDEPAGDFFANPAATERD